MDKSYEFYGKIVLSLLCLFLAIGSFFLSLENIISKKGEAEILLDTIKKDTSLVEAKKRFEQLRKININEADEVDLLDIPGIGNVMAGRIVAFREERGRISSLKDLLDIEGIGEKKLEKISQWIVFDDEVE